MSRINFIVLYDKINCHIRQFYHCCCALKKTTLMQTLVYSVGLQLFVNVLIYGLGLLLSLCVGRKNKINSSQTCTNLSKIKILFYYLLIGLELVYRVFSHLHTTDRGYDQLADTRDKVT